MSDEEDDFDPKEIIAAINAAPDAAQLLEFLSPLVDLKERDSKNVKKMKLFMQTITHELVSLRNTLRSLILFLNMEGIINIDSDEAPDFDVLKENDKMYA